MDNPIIYQALGVLLILFFLFLIYMFTKTWRWFHVLLMPCVFGAAIWFCCVAAMSFRTHAAWRQLVEDNREKAEAAQEEYNNLMFGDLTEVVQTTPSIRVSDAKFARMVFDRGRVWRECAPDAPQGNTVVVKLAPPEDGAAATATQMFPGMILYAFTEDVAPEGTKVRVGTKLPDFYIGEFTATAADPSSVTLQPTLPLTADQGTAVSNGKSWTLFETMPVDGHNFFATDVNEVPDLNERADVAPVFGTIDPAFANTFLPEASREEYLRDGKLADPDADPVGHIWVKVVFLEAHTEDVDSTATLDGVVGSQSWFNQGLAEIPLLQRGGQAKFKVGQIGVFPQVDAERLIAAGICERRENVYVRTLNDYEYQFRAIHLRLVRIQQDLETVQGNLDKVTALNTQTTTQIAYRTQERDKLDQDKAKYLYEAEQIGNYQQSLQQVLDVTKAELSRLYRTNGQLEQELDRMNDELTEEIDRRTREALTEAG